MRLLYIISLLLTAAATAWSQQPASPVQSAPEPGAAEAGVPTAPSTTSNPVVPPPRTQRLASLQRTSGFGRLSRVPYMVGDAFSNPLVGVRTDGPLPLQSIELPTLAAQRTNIAENNSPLVRDRAFFTYYHFHNANSVTAFPGQIYGGTRDVSFDRWLIGFEKTLGEITSLEFRLPLVSELDSDLLLSSGNLSPSAGLSQVGQQGEVGNLGFILKTILYSEAQLAFTAGMGVTAPTGADTRVTNRVDDPNFLVTFRQSSGGSVARIPTQVNSVVDLELENETWYLTPYLAFAAAPSDRFFLQGFWQIDLAASASDGRVNSDVQVPQFGVTGPPLSNAVRYDPANLMRFNLGGGTWLWRDANRTISSAAMMLEFHYTTSLEAGSLERVRLTQDSSFFTSSELLVGSLGRRTDLLNVVLGIPLNIGRTQITNGFAAPIRSGDERVFDFEYSLLINRLF